MVASTAKAEILGAAEHMKLFCETFDFLSSGIEPLSSLILIKLAATWAQRLCATMSAALPKSVSWREQTLPQSGDICREKVNDVKGRFSLMLLHHPFKVQ
jgi:hypothetical protein